ncbi:MAG: ABC transporter ATP-binding protein, partial [Spirillospora sp.]
MRTRTILRSSFRRRRGEFARLVGWSLVEAVPAFWSGHLVARAVDRGFLAGHFASGLGWLAAMAAVTLVGAWGTRQAYLRLGSLVEPFRDELVTLAAGAALRRSTLPPQRPETAGVARLTHQVEVVREAYATVVMITLGFVISATSTLLGLVTLAPAVLVLVLPPLLIGLGLFLGALRAMAARQRATILADERIAETTTALGAGFRDILACGAQERVRAAIGEHVDDQARATRDLARLTAVRTAALGVGGRVPLVLVLLAAPWLVRHGTTAGAVLGALTYLMHGLQPALQTLVRGLGGSGLWLMVTLGRIAESADVPDRH